MSFARRKRLGFVLGSLLVGIGAMSARAELITVEYTATGSAPFGGTPFGVTVPAGTTVTGTFTYDTATPDSNSNSSIGDYYHSLSAPGFTANFLGHTVTGSLTPKWQMAGVVMHLYDGPSKGGGIMSFDGTANSDYRMHLDISPNNPNLYPIGTLPTSWPFYFGFLGDPHTFIIESDGSNWLQLQFTSATQVPEPSSVLLLGVGVAAAMVRVRRRK